jgi:CRISPR/Cas system Type II protein with McrA/HNH and RuvC-like nuclease domain
MKLHAYADQKDKGARDLGRHHAIDASSVVGMTTEDEYDRAERFSREDCDTEPVRRARRIIVEDFGSETALGILRLREHPLFRDEFEIGQFIAVLTQLFVE